MKTLHNPLFSAISGGQKTEELIKRVAFEIDRMDDSKFSNESLQATIDSMIDRYKIVPVTISENRVVNEPKKLDGKKTWSIELPFNGSSDVFSIKPAQGNIERPKADIKHIQAKGYHLVFEYEMEIEYSLEYPNELNHKAIAVILDLLPNVNSEVGDINSMVKNYIQQKAFQRKKSIDKDREYLNQI